MADEDDMTIGELGRIVARIERKLDEVTGDHEKRLRALEQHNATLRGWLIGATAAGGLGTVSGLSGLIALLAGG